MCCSSSLCRQQTLSLSHLNYYAAIAYSLCRGAAMFAEAPVWGNDSCRGYHRLLWLLRISAYGPPLKDFDIGSGDQLRASQHPSVPRWQIFALSQPSEPSSLWANLAGRRVIPNALL